MPNRAQSEEAIATLNAMCSENKDWYGDYIFGNAPRIVGDADFISSRIQPNASVLDIGAIPPLFVELLRRRGFQSCTVADLHPEPFAKYFVETGVTSFKANVLDKTPKEFREQFDVVCLNEVVEHLAGNLLVAIQNAVDCVRPGGYLMVTTPNLRSIWGLVALLVKSSGLASKPNGTVREQYDRASAQFGYYGHIREYTKKEVVHLFGTFGLSLHSCTFQANYLPLGRLTRTVALVERLFPEWRLFGKYLFQKPSRS